LLEPLLAFGNVCREINRDADGQRSGGFHLSVAGLGLELLIEILVLAAADDGHFTGTEPVTQLPEQTQFTVTPVNASVLREYVTLPGVLDERHARIADLALALRIPRPGILQLVIQTSLW
jgi:hypothetical protein